MVPLLQKEHDVYLGTRGQIDKKDTLAAFLKKNNVDAPIEEFVKAFKEKKEAEGELADDDAEAVAGGRFLWW